MDGSRRAQQEPALGSKKTAPLVIADGTLEGMKWLGLILMTFDHVNKFVFAEKLPVIFEASRLVMPLFGFVLAYNMARPNALATGTYGRVAKRLLVYGLLATPPFMMMTGLLPLNILFTLLVSVVIMHLIDVGGRLRLVAAVLLFVSAGALAEFRWFGIASCLAAWAYCRKPTTGWLVSWSASTASLFLVNGNLWSMAVIPIILVAPEIRAAIQHRPRVFYAYYPAHLWALALALQ